MIQNKTKNTESIDLYIEREKMVISDRACVHPHGARVSEEDARDHWVGRTSFFHFCSNFLWLTSILPLFLVTALVLAAMAYSSNHYDAVFDYDGFKRIEQVAQVHQRRLHPCPWGQCVQHVRTHDREAQTLSTGELDLLLPLMLILEN